MKSKRQKAFKFRPIKQDVAKLIEMVHFVSVPFFKTKYRKISIRSRNLEIISKFSKFFDIEIDRNFDQFRSFSKIFQIFEMIEILRNYYQNDRDSSKLLSKRSKFFEISIEMIEILRNYYQNDRNSSKLPLKPSKLFEITESFHCAQTERERGS